jgi:C-terminal binding protein
LAVPGVDTLAPWTDVPEDLRKEVDGLMILKVYLTEKDMDLFPKLKV